MTKDLTEQWKNGELEERQYFVRMAISDIVNKVDYFCGEFYTIDEDYVFDDSEISEVLAPVPSYEEWKIASEQLNKNGVWYTERSYKELKKEKRALEVSVSNRDNTIQELREENAKLKELLKEAREVIYNLIDDEPCWLDHHGYCQTHGWMSEDLCPNEGGKELLNKIDEVLNVAED